MTSNPIQSHLFRRFSFRFLLGYGWINNSLSSHRLPYLAGHWLEHSSDAYPKGAIRLSTIYRSWATCRCKRYYKKCCMGPNRGFQASSTSAPESSLYLHATKTWSGRVEKGLGTLESGTEEVELTPKKTTDARLNKYSPSSYLRPTSSLLPLSLPLHLSLLFTLDGLVAREAWVERIFL